MIRSLICFPNDTTEINIDNRMYIGRPYLKTPTKVWKLNIDCYIHIAQKFGYIFLPPPPNFC